MRVRSWLLARPLDSLLTGAVDDAIQYVLDGSRTGRFDLDAPDVDSDERRTVGTKLQYRVIHALGLEKCPPLDTQIEGVPVELKGTVRSTWMIPREGQCEVSLLIQVDSKRDRHRAFLMRAHERWLNPGRNGDKKRSITAGARDAYALPVLGWTPLPVTPLKRLTVEQRDVVFRSGVGQARRLTELFGFLPGVVVPRRVLLTVCANREDPLRRVREVKASVRSLHNLELLCGAWKADQRLAGARGLDITDGSWVAVPGHALPTTA